MLRKDLKQRSSRVAREVRIPGTQAQARGAPAPAGKKVAVFVAHGMGQQIPFETMDAVAEGLAHVAGLPATAPGTAIRAATALVDGQKLQRIEMDLPGPEGEASVEVHIYEGYWAPLTEGEVGIRDVLSFLLRGGWNGICNAGSPFYRWMFGRPVRFDPQVKAAVWLVVALFVVLSLVVVNFLVTAVFADRILGRIASGDVGGLALSDAAFTALTTLVGAWVLYTVVLAVALYGTHLARPDLPPVDRPASRGWTVLLHVLLLLWVIATIALGPMIALVAAGSMDLEGGVASFNTYSLLVWAGLLFVSWRLRRLVIQYQGDVAAYIATHTLDRFHELRMKIKAKIAITARAIYATPEYESVVVVGHSLGSVIVYDVLNALMVDEALGNARGVAARTRLLLTFGSPLDKIAYIFALQWGKTTETREALAGSLQPLIMDYARFRNLRWVNLHAPGDVISGALDFFDDRSQTQHAGRFVENQVDPAASTPLLAHVEYWNNRLLYERMYEGIFS